MKNTGLILTIVAVAFGLAGCIDQELAIRSEPSGALVFVSDKEVGRTPVTIPFTWYGDYDIVLRMDGYQTIKTHAKLNPPVYGIPPLDLLATLAPWTFHDRRYLYYEMKTYVAPSDEELIMRGEALGKRTLEPVKK